MTGVGSGRQPVGGGSVEKGVRRPWSRFCAGQGGRLVEKRIRLINHVPFPHLSHHQPVSFPAYEICAVAWAWPERHAEGLGRKEAGGEGRVSVSNYLPRTPPPDEERVVLRFCPSTIVKARPVSRYHCADELMRANISPLVPSTLLYLFSSTLGLFACPTLTISSCSIVSLYFVLRVDGRLCVCGGRVRVEQRRGGEVRGHAFPPPFTISSTAGCWHERTSSSSSLSSSCLHSCG